MTRADRDWYREQIARKSPWAAPSDPDNVEVPCQDCPPEVKAALIEAIYDYTQEGK
jgi:hypothetical protein